MEKFTLSCVALAAALVCAQAQAINMEVIDVGDNPFNGFASTGGTGTIGGSVPGQQATVLKDFTSLGDVPIILHTSPSSGVDVLHIDERVTNNSGVDWTDFHLIFGGIDNNPALSVAFDNVLNPTGEFVAMSASTNVLSLFGPVPTGHTFSLSFDLVATSEDGAFDLFGIHEVPSVAEPSALALLGVGLLGAGSLRRKSRFA